MKEPKSSICYWPISITLGSGIAGLNFRWIGSKKEKVVAVMEEEEEEEKETEER